MAEDKYKMFLNYMHNELGISKDDIKLWVREAVEAQAKVVAHQLVPAAIERAVKATLSEWSGSMKHDIRTALAARLAEQIKIELK